MDKDTTQAKLYEHYLGFILPEGMLDFFELVWMETMSLTARESKKDIAYTGILHIHLDERDNRTEGQRCLRPNGFTEPTTVSDFPVRDRRVELHIRRRRWLDPEGRSVILNIYPLAAEGTRYSVEFAEFLKKNLDTTPVTARCLGKYYFTDGDTLERCYKESLSGFRQGGQSCHAEDWVLLPANMGEHLSIDESSLQDDLFTFLTNKDGHCRRGSLIAAVRGTKAEDVLDILLRIPEEDRLKVKEVTADLSDTMAAIVHAAFPNATLALDCFHIMKRCNDAIEELRLRYRREALAEHRRLELEHRKRLRRNAAQRRWYRKKHPKAYRGKPRGRKPMRKNEKFKPPVLSNGDTRNELLKRSRYALTQTPDKWSERQTARMRLLFELYPKIKEAYDIVNRLRSIFRSSALTRETAKPKFQEWYKAVNKCSLREVKAARDALKSREDEILNYFIDHSTNAGAESFNSKIKGFRAQLRGVSDLPFFMFRLCAIFG